MRLSKVVPALLVAAVVALTGCSEESPGTADRQIEIYAAVLSWLLEKEVPLPPQAPQGEDGEDGEAVEVPPVFVESFGPGVDLQVQVELVARFEEQGYDLHFLDTRSEAVDEDEPDVPVRDEAVLVGLGPIPEGSPVDVRAEIYRGQADLEAYRFRLARRAGAWAFVQEPTPVEPEGFVTTP